LPHDETKQVILVIGASGKLTISLRATSLIKESRNP